jgi:hypothetical protein
MPASLLRSALLALAFFAKAGVLTWGTFATYFAPLPSVGLRVVLALLFLAIGLAALFVRPSRATFRLFAAATVLTLAGWVLKKPSHQRDWSPDLAVLPTAAMEGDTVTLFKVRDFDHHSKTEFTPRYIDSTVRLSQLESMDLFVSHWSSDLIAHTFVSFNFTDSEPICISIEARHEKGESYSPIASCFKESELIYVVGTERDLIGVRTLHRNEAVHLYRVQASPIALRRLFLTYLERINRLSREPEFYHLLSNNCTVNIRNHASGSAKNPFDLRVLLNGKVDAYAYDLGLLDTSVPFPELRARALITPAAVGATGTPQLSEVIRQHLHPHP